ncbi:alpha/beta fold hydrolase [Lichenifustis flavocetrariae]|uniref:Alpha/beta fold hydrolase n=1 Tax=Lichenifustis flavocetrariae TaxID=2949735 RepID=A0AA41Z1M9_9HYPH|nr:alpha/beta fold hydrolase [Lichenifustis flavocetrariae]MCW6511190.1 alpha/beta fold hydrolase [Lichenifustis flavocetrariae]
MSQQSIVRSNGVDLATRLDGEPGRPWMVLSNGLASTMACWDLQIPMLTRTHRVLRYDTRGHGDSAAFAGPTSLAELGRDVLGLMDHFGIARADVIGLSMGGMTLLGLAIAHGARLGRVICCDARADAPPPFVANWDTRIAAVRDGGMAAIVDITIERWFTPAFAAREPAAIEAAAAMIQATDPDGYIACAGALKQLDYRRSLGAIRAPTLFVCGAQDLAAAPAVMRDMVGATPGSVYAEVDPGAHVCNVENPERFDAVVGAWLATTADAA